MKAISPELVRVDLFLLFGAIIVMRLAFPKVREALDLVNIVLICVFYTVILREDIRSLISQMKGVGFPGIQIPLNDLENKVNSINQLYIPDVSHYTTSDIDLPENFNLFPNEQKLNILSDKIDSELNRISNAYKKRSKDSEYIPNEVLDKVKYLRKNNVVGKEIYHSVELFWKIKDEYDSRKEERRLVNVARKLLLLLITIKEKIKDLGIAVSKNGVSFLGNHRGMSTSGTQTSRPESGKVKIYTSLNVLDNKYNAFPIYNLDNSNIKIYENYHDSIKEIKSVSIRPVGVRTNFLIIIAVDISHSMRDDKKLEYAKEAIKNLVDQMAKIVDTEQLKFILYPFSSDTRGQVELFENGSKFTNQINDLKSRVESLVTKSGTPLLDAIYDITEYADYGHGYCMSILVSDGDEQHSTMSEDRLFEIIKETHIPIFTIGYGKKADLILLQNVSILTGAGGADIGSFMKVPPEKLPNLLSFIITSAANLYEIEWISSFNDKEEVKYTIDVEYSTDRYGKINSTFEGQIQPNKTTT
jgi:Mg-chelatase subunit ChlD